MSSDSLYSSPMTLDALPPLGSLPATDHRRRLPSVSKSRSTSSLSSPLGSSLLRLPAASGSLSLNKPLPGLPPLDLSGANWLNSLSNCSEKPLADGFGGLSPLPPSRTRSHSRANSLVRSRAGSYTFSDLGSLPVSSAPLEFDDIPLYAPLSIPRQRRGSGSLGRAPVPYGGRPLTPLPLLSSGLPDLLIDERKSSRSSSSTFASYDDGGLYSSIGCGQYHSAGPSLRSQSALHRPLRRC